MKKVNQIRAGAVLSYVSLGIGNLISLIYTPIMLRLLGQSEYGVYNIANSLVGYLGVLDLGMGNAIIRYAAKYKTLKDEEAEYRLYGMFLIIYSIISILVLILGYILIINSQHLFKNTLTVQELASIKIMLSIMMLNLAISFPLSIFSSIIIAYEHFIFPKLLTIIRQLINPFLTIPLLLLGYGSIGMVTITTIINIAIGIINILYCIKKLKIKLYFNKVDFSVMREISKYSFFIFITMIADRIYWSTDQFILGSVVNSISVAVYSISSTLTTYYSNFSTALSGIFLPKITRMVTEKEDISKISNLFIRIGRIQFIIMSYILGGFIVVGREFIKLWAGDGYEESYIIALIIMIPFTIDLIQNTGIAIIQAKNKNHFRALTLFLIGIINIFISIPLAKLYGGIGCAISTAFSLIIGNGMLNVFYYKKIKLDIISFWKQIIKMSIPVFLSLSASLVISQYYDVKGIIFCLINGILYTALFFTLMWGMGMNLNEKQMVLSPIKLISRKFGLIYCKRVI